MNVYEYAMKVEVEGEQYYRNLAKECDDAGLRQVFNMLADEEVKHFKTFEAMRNNAPIPTQEESDIFLNAKSIFEKFQGEKTCNNLEKDQVEAYKRALQLEEKSYEFYVQKAAEIDNPEQKAAFLKIAKEEEYHKTLMENIIEYITNPERFIESAEFHNSSKEVG